MYGYIYLTTNLLNNKKYIGKHTNKTFNSKYLGSGYLLKQAVKKYGRENFKCELLEECCDKIHLNNREIYWIKYYNACNDPMYYNIAKGGDGGLNTNKILINNGKVNKYINENDLDNFIDIGWVLGLKPGRINGPKNLKTKQLMSNLMINKKHLGNWDKNQKQSFKNKHYHWFTNGELNILIKACDSPPRWLLQR